MVQRGTRLTGGDLIAALAGGASAGLSAYGQERERQRVGAGRRAEGIQAQIQAALLGGQGAEAAGLLPQYGEAFSQATGADFRPSVAGGALPDGGRDFNNPRTLAAIRALSGLPQPEPPKPLEVSAGATLVNPRTGQVMFQAPFAPSSALTFDQRMALQSARMDASAARQDDAQAFRAQQAQRPQASQAGGANDMRALKALEDWRRRREAEPQRILDNWIRLNSNTFTDMRGNKRTQAPMPAAIEAERERIAKEWEARNPSPPAPGGQGRPDPFGNP